jgi:cytochrome P450
MSFLKRLDAAPAEQRWALARAWINTAPVDFFEELREHRPILETDGPTLVAYHTDVFEVLDYPTIFTVDLNKLKMGNFMLALDDTPINQRDKSVMRAMLNRDDAGRIRETVGRLARQALAEVSSPLELVGAVSRKVPVQLVGEYFGFPGPDRETMLRWSKATQFDQFFNLPFDPLPESEQVHADALAALKDMKDYLAGLIKQRRAELDSGRSDLDDILSRLLRTNFPPGVGFGMDRVVINTGGLLIGAVETTSLAVVYSLEQLLKRPVYLEGARRAAAAGDDERLAGHVWEALRFKPFLPYLVRKTSVDYTLARGSKRQRTIPAGTTVLALTMSAMFDPDWTCLPREFHPDRPPRVYLHFGRGHHECLGVHVAQVMIPEIVKQLLLLKNLRPAPGPDGQIDYQGGPLPERFVLEFDR